MGGRGGEQSCAKLPRAADRGKYCVVTHLSNNNGNSVKHIGEGGGKPIHLWEVTEYFSQFIKVCVRVFGKREAFLASPLPINHWPGMSEQTSEMDERITDQGGGTPALVSLRETTQALWD